MAVGVGDDDGGLLRLRLVDERARQRRGLFQQAVEALLQHHLEDGVIDVVAAAAGVQAPGEIGGQVLFQRVLDQEEQILDRAGVRGRFEVEVLLGRGQGARDGARLIGLEDPGLGQHHTMSAVDAAEGLDEIGLGPFEERGEHRLLEDGGGEFVVGSGVSAHVT